MEEEGEGVSELAGIQCQLPQLSQGPTLLASYLYVNLIL